VEAGLRADAARELYRGAGVDVSGRRRTARASVSRSLSRTCPSRCGWTARCGRRSC
jgi:hypothetical protein